MDNRSNRTEQMARYDISPCRVSLEEAAFQSELQEVSLRDLLQEECDIELNFKCIKLQLLRIIQLESTKSGKD